MRRLSCAGCLSALLVACGPSPGQCDQDALRRAAAATDARMSAWSPADGALPDFKRPAVDIRGACPRLPDGFFTLLEYSVFPQPRRSSDEYQWKTPLRDDSAALRPLRDHCPELDAVLERVAVTAAASRNSVLHEGCRYADIALFSRDELATLGAPQDWHGHALYLWLVRDGAPPEVARALVRPLVAGTDFALDLPIDLGGLPAVDAGAPADWTRGLPFAVTRDAAIFDGRRLVSLAQGQLDGHDRGLVGPVYDAFAEEADKARVLAERTGRAEPLQLAVAADRELPWATMGPLVYSAWRAGFQLDVRALVPVPLRPLASVPLLAASAAPAADLRLAEEGVVVRCGDDERPVELAAVAEALGRCDAKTVRLAVAPETRWRRVTALAAALAGHARVVALADFPAPPVQ